MIDPEKDALYLVLSSFKKGQFDPGGGLLPIDHRELHIAETFTVADIHAFTNTSQSRIVRISTHLYEVSPLNPVRRVTELLGELSVIRQDHQTLCVEIEAADREQCFP